MEKKMYYVSANRDNLDLGMKRKPKRLLVCIITEVRKEMK